MAVSVRTSLAIEKAALNVRLSDGPINFNSLDNDEMAPYSFNLNQAYPNPFNPIINIPFSLSKVSNVKIDIYDINGNKIDKITNQIL